jgi:hypothetical protein
MRWQERTSGADGKGGRVGFPRIPMKPRVRSKAKMYNNTGNDINLPAFGIMRPGGGGLEHFSSPAILNVRLEKTSGLFGES